jgi:FADH2 O2-dependent halogenase
MKASFDIAIVGSGFSGSLLAMIARRLGRSVVLLERGGHPRFAIGESSTPLANLLLEELATRYELPRLLPLTKWGTWQKSYPEIACGLKRGFTFLHHRAGQEWTPQPDRSNELMVAASPHDAIADTHWYRSEFDHFLVREAQALGVEYIDRVQLEKASDLKVGMELQGRRFDERVNIQAQLILDASGPHGFLHSILDLGASRQNSDSFAHDNTKDEAADLIAPANQPTQALYTHFTGVRRWDELFSSSSKPPYPMDDAAVHHIFEGGWIWVLRFNNGLISAGVAATSALANELRLQEGALAWSRLLDRFPSIREQFKHATPQLPFMHTPCLSFRSPRAGGSNWALLPSTAGLI